MHVQNVRKQGAAELRTGVVTGVDLSAAFDLASAQPPLWLEGLV